MAGASSKVTATAGPTADTVRVAHGDFPDLGVDGDSIEDAAAELVLVLSRAIDEAEDDAQRAALHRAVADVQAFIERPEAE